MTKSRKEAGMERNILKEPVSKHLLTQLRAEPAGADRVKMQRTLSAVRSLEGTASLQAILGRAAAPEACGPEIPVAPARGPCIAAPQVSLVPNGKDDWVEDDGGFAGRAAARVADVFDLMMAAAVKAKLPPPFTPGQIAMARHYRGLVERHDAGGVKLSQLDRGTGGGSGRDFMDTFLAEAEEIDRVRRRIGTGSALQVRRIRPSERGSRRSIPDRAVVDMVCLGNRPITSVLTAHGWGVNVRVVRAVREALSASLDRMIGYGHEKRS